VRNFWDRVWRYHNVFYSNPSYFQRNLCIFISGALEIFLKILPFSKWSPLLQNLNISLAFFYVHTIQLSFGGISKNLTAQKLDVFWMWEYAMECLKCVKGVIFDKYGTRCLKCMKGVKTGQKSVKKCHKVSETARKVSKKCQKVPKSVRKCAKASGKCQEVSKCVRKVSKGVRKCRKSVRKVSKSVRKCQENVKKSVKMCQKSVR